MNDRPTAGRIVHFVPTTESAYAGQHLAAIVALANGNELNLGVFAPCGSLLIPGQKAVPFDPEGKQPYSWHWPERTLGVSQ